MTWIIGVLLGAGVLLIASPWLWPAGSRQPRERRGGRLVALASEAGTPRLTPALIALLTIASGVLAAAIVWLFTRIPPLALVAFIAGGCVPILVLRSRRQRRIAARRSHWPDICDLLVASTRAGMSLPDSVASLADVGPEPLRSDFARFRRDLAASGHFDSSVARLKESLADATADRIIETLRMARQVGGTELPSVLRALSAAVRSETEVRGEVLAKQSWIRAAAILGVIAPWLILAMLSLRPEGAAAYSSPGGVLLIVVTAVVSVLAYRIMARIGRLPDPRRWFG